MQAYTSVSARHDKLNARLKRLIERDLVERTVSGPATKPTSPQLESSMEADQKFEGKSVAPLKLSPDAYLRKLIDEEALAG